VNILLVSAQRISIIRIKSRRHWRVPLVTREKGDNNNNKTSWRRLSFRKQSRERISDTKIGMWLSVEHLYSTYNIQYETGTAMNARESENYLAISHSSSASKNVEIFGPRYTGDDFFRAESSLIQSNCRSLRNLKS
jgi:hypothetical protein